MTNHESSRVPLKRVNWPTIIGYFDLNLNCLYSAIERTNGSLIKHMVTSKDPEFYNQPMVRVEMSYAGYTIQPVVVKDQGYQSFEKRSSNTHPKAVHWAINWFKADYQRWLTLSHHDKRDIAKVLGSETKSNSKEKIYTNPTTSFISRVGIIELIAGHVANAYCCDMDDGEKDCDVEKMLDMYINQFELTEKHGVAIRHKISKLLDSFNLSGAIKQSKEKGICTGVDLFIGNR